MRDWVKSKNPDAPAVKREAEEDWAKEEVALTPRAVCNSARQLARVIEERPYAKRTPARACGRTSGVSGTLIVSMV
jgi:hypothetical protein